MVRELFELDARRMNRKHAVTVWGAGMLLGVLGPVASAQVVIPDDYATIGEAIRAIEAGTELDHDIVIEPGTYTERVTLIDNITLRGRETARTFLSGGGSGALVTADGVSGARVRNLTFIDADTGVLIQGAGSGLEIANNVFDLGGSATGVRVADAATGAGATVANNVFFQLGTGVRRLNTQITVQNNIFSGNVTAIDTPADQTAQIITNGFFDNDNEGATGNVPVTGSSAGFVNPVARDFHLRPGSVAINSGTGTDVIDATVADLGAYGGPNADAFPFPVSGLGSTTAEDNAITLSWSENLGYRVGGYKVHYGRTRGGPYEGTDAGEGASPIGVLDDTITSLTLTGLTPQNQAAPSEAPQPAEPIPSNGTLSLRWSAVSGATGYLLHWGIDSVDENQRDVGNATRVDLSGLTNETTYQVSVSAYARDAIFFAVAAHYEQPRQEDDPVVLVDPGSALVNEVEAPFGAIFEGPRSAPVLGTPELLLATPNLPDEGCFVATAAFGSYSVSQVRLLRDLRDRHLLHSGPGQAFVRWYYQRGPIGARWLNRHPVLKPLARTALLPAVGLASQLTGGTPLLLLLLLAGVGGSVGYALRENRRAGEAAA